MDALIASQTIFYFVSSIAILALGGALLYAIWELIKILKNARDVSDDLNSIYHKTKRRITKAIGSFGKK